MTLGCERWGSCLGIDISIHVALYLSDAHKCYVQQWSGVQKCQSGVSQSLPQDAYHIAYEASLQSEMDSWGWVWFDEDARRYFLK